MNTLQRTMIQVSRAEALLCRSKFRYLINFLHVLHNNKFIDNFLFFYIDKMCHSG